MRLKFSNKIKLNYITFLFFFLFSNLIFLKNLFQTHLNFNRFSLILLCILLFLFFLIFIKNNFQLYYSKTNIKIYYFIILLFYYFIILFLFNYGPDTKLNQLYGILFKFFSFLIILLSIQLNAREEFYKMFCDVLFYITIFSLFYYILALTNIINYEFGFIVHDSTRYLRLGSLCGEPSVYSFLLYIGNVITFYNKHYYKFFLFLIAGLLTFSNLYYMFLIVTFFYIIRKKYLLVLLFILLLYFLLFIFEIKLLRFSAYSLSFRLAHTIHLIEYSNLFIGNGLYSLFTDSEIAQGAGVGKFAYDFGFATLIIVLILLIKVYFKIDNDTKKLIFIACILNIFLQDTYTSITQYTFLIYALQKN
jgi:hypothetical protein